MNTGPRALTFQSPMHTSDALRLSDAPLIQQLTAHGLRPNMLVVSRDLRLDSIVRYLMDWCPAPSAVAMLPGELAMPPAATGTWFLQDVSQLTAPQQRDLQAWLAEDEARRVQLVSISSEPLWPLVRRGRFLERLYYALNTIVVDATTADGSTYDEGAGAPRS